MNAKNMQEENFSEFETLETLSPEEKDKIFKEMENLFESNQSNSQKLLNLSNINIPKGLKFPVIFNILLVSFVGFAILGAFFTLNQKNRHMFDSIDNINQISTNSDLALEIIEQSKIALEEQKNALNNINVQLSALLNAQNGLDNLYLSRKKKYQDDFEKDLAFQQSKLRKNLENKNVAEEEILKRLQKQEVQLRLKYNAKLDKFNKQQEEEKQQQETQYSNQISILQKEYDTKQKKIDKLANEINQKEAKLENQQPAIDYQLTNTQSTFNNLYKNKEKQQKALEEFNIYHQNIINLIKSNKFNEAKDAIALAISNISTNPYNNSVEAHIYSNAYATYSIMIDVAIALQKTLTSSSGKLTSQLTESQNIDPEVINKLQQKISEQETLIASLQTLNKSDSSSKKLTSQQLTESQNIDPEVINKLQQKISEQEALITSLQSLNKSDGKKINSLQRQLSELETVYASALDELETSNLKARGVTKDDINDILNNIRLIANYLALKNAGIDDESTRNFILSFIQEHLIYQSVIDIMLEAIDPSGKLVF